jgi:diaminopimelate epimerase
MILPFTKMQGVGNDFIVVDGRMLPQHNWSALAPHLCDRRFGIGSDGILVIEDASGADARMRMFNPDGTEDFCGNGLRCVARYVADRWTTDDRRQTELTLVTSAGPRKAEIHSDTSITVEMGEPKFAPNEIPFTPFGRFSNSYHEYTPIAQITLDIDGELIFALPLSTGTTHTIIFHGRPTDERFFRISPKIERHRLFPQRTSVMWVDAAPSQRLIMRIWERGVGETWGCGSGACAAAVAANLMLRGYSGDETIVDSKGGELIIRWDRTGPILMTGPAEYVFEGHVDLSALPSHP